MAKRSTLTNWPHSAEAEAHICSEFNRSGIEYRNGGGKNIKLNCPFPHESGVDSGFHMEILKDGRKCHCWVCDWKGSWNKLARETGMATFADIGSSNTYTDKVANTNMFAKLSSDFNEVFSLEEEDELPYGLKPWKEPTWRGISLEFMSKVQSFQWNQPFKADSGSSGVTKRVLWPYYQCGRLVGYVGRRLDKGDFQKYYRAPWCKAKNVLFPFDYVKESFPKTEFVVLVEGEVDALNLLQASIPTLSILGSNNWSDHKRDLLLSLGVKRVYLLMDPDAPGRSAAQYIKEQLTGYFELHTLAVEPPDDPGSLDADQLKWLAKHVSAKKR